jgi:uncharacterized OB-fold protein
MTRTCSKCGSTIHHPIAYFCTECGAMLDEGMREE